MLAYVGDKAEVDVEAMDRYYNITFIEDRYTIQAISEYHLK
jgi:hypothetical protein